LQPYPFWDNPAIHMLNAPITEDIFAYENYSAQAESFLVCEEKSDYHPRNPDDNPLYEIVAGNLETFLALQSERDRPVPRFVERELRNFLDCGVLAKGFPLYWSKELRP
jgi:hypothetical protein